MLLALIVAISFINSESMVFASVLGGVGFGTFIDELGKFITSDNNYFYQPTIALIYVIFIFLFLILKYLSTIAKYSSKTYTANAVEGLKELVISDLNKNERQKSLQYLKYSDKNDPVAKMLYDLIKHTRPEKNKFSFYNAIKNFTLRLYSNTLRVKFISNVLIGFFIVSTLSGLVFSLYLILDLSITQLSLKNYGYLLSTAAVVILVSVSIYHYVRKNRLKFFTYLQKATLVQIFLSQFFLFLQDELAAMIWLFLYITVYIILKYSIQAEKQIRLNNT